MALMQNIYFTNSLHSCRLAIEQKQVQCLYSKIGTYFKYGTKAELNFLWLEVLI